MNMYGYVCILGNKEHWNYLLVYRQSPNDALCLSVKM